jgi:hypothetical protein
VKFASLGIAAIDGIFNDIAELVNPVIVLSKDLFDARKRLEQAMKAISEFRDDPSKAFDDYLEELKKRLKKGECEGSKAVRFGQGMFSQCENHLTIPTKVRPQT